MRNHPEGMGLLKYDDNSYTLESLLPKTCLEPDCELESVQLRLSLDLCGFQPARDTQLKD